MASLITAVTKVGGTTLLSRLLGFIRDLTIARLFGADGATDAFFVAFKVPNLFRRVFTEGAFSLALVPVLSEYRAQRPFIELKGLVDRLAGTLGAGLLFITVAAILAAPLLLLVFAPGLADETDQREQAIEMLRITLPYLLLITLTAIAGGILHTYERFGVPAFTPVLLNLALIACALWLAPLMERPIVALAWGVLIAGLAQLIFQVPFLIGLKLLPRPRLAPRDPGVRRIIRLMAPALIGVSVTQINLLIDTLLASFLAAGSISWLYYSDRLVELPLGLLGVALGTIILPRLTGHRAGASPRERSQTLDWGLRLVLLLGLPATVGLMVLAGPLIITLFLSGQFGPQDAEMASLSLIAYAAGLLPFMAIKVLAPAFYARQETRVPLRIAGIALTANLAISLALMHPLGHTGLALGTSLAAAINAILLLLSLIRIGVYHVDSRWAGWLTKGCLAAALMGGAIHLGSGSMADWLAMGGAQRIGHLAAWIAIGALVYFVSLFLTGVRPRDLRGPG